MSAPDETTTASGVARADPMVIEPGEVMGKQIELDQTRNVWVGRYDTRTLIRMVNSKGDVTKLVISAETRAALVQLLLEDCA